MKKLLMLGILACFKLSVSHANSASLIFSTGALNPKLKLKKALDTSNWDMDDLSKNAPIKSLKSQPFGVSEYIIEIKQSEKKVNKARIAHQPNALKDL